MDVFFDWKWWLIGKIQHYLRESPRWYKKKEFESKPVYKQEF